MIGDLVTKNQNLFFPEQFGNASSKERDGFGCSERSSKFNLSAIEAPEEERSWQR